MSVSDMTYSRPRGSRGDVVSQHGQELHVLMCVQEQHVLSCRLAGLSGLLAWAA